MNVVNLNSQPEVVRMNGNQRVRNAVSSVRIQGRNLNTMGELRPSFSRLRISRT